MDRKTFYKITLQTVLPLMLQSLLTSCVNFIDQIMVGKLGVAEIAAVGVANKLYSLFYLVLYGTVHHNETPLPCPPCQSDYQQLRTQNLKGSN